MNEWPNEDPPKPETDEPSPLLAEAAKRADGFRGTVLDGAEEAEMERLGQGPTMLRYVAKPFEVRAIPLKEYRKRHQILLPGQMPDVADGVPSDHWLVDVPGLGLRLFLPEAKFQEMFEPSEKETEQQSDEQVDG